MAQTYHDPRCNYQRNNCSRALSRQPAVATPLKNWCIMPCVEIVSDYRKATNCIAQAEPTASRCKAEIVSRVSLWHYTHGASHSGMQLSADYAARATALQKQPASPTYFRTCGSYRPQQQQQQYARYRWKCRAGEQLSQTNRPYVRTAAEQLSLAAATSPQEFWLLRPLQATSAAVHTYRALRYGYTKLWTTHRTASKI